MKRHIKYIRLCTIGFLSAFTFWACQSGSSTKKENKTEEHDHEHAEAPAGNITSLTKAQMDQIGLKTGHLEERNLTANISANGILRVPNNNRSSVTPLYSGIIESLHVQLGDVVRKGQLIAVIKNPQFIQTQEEYLNTNNDIQMAEQELQRQQELNAGSAGVKRNLQNATNQLQILRTKKASLSRQLQIMGINPNQIDNNNLRATISVTSPIPGVVSQVFDKIGAYADATSPIVEVVDNSMIHLDLQVFERDLPKLKLGQEIAFQVTNNPEKNYLAKIMRLGSSFENESKTIAVHCLVTGDKAGLIDGSNTFGSISLNQVLTAAVPDEAIAESKGKYFIFIETDKQVEEEHDHEEHAGHEHGQEPEAPEKGHQHDEKEHTETKNSKNFEKIEVVKGVSHLGFTGITPVTDIPKDANIVIKGAFFINAKFSGTVGHSH